MRIHRTLIFTGMLLAAMAFSSTAAYAVTDPAYTADASEYIFPSSSTSLLYDGHFTGMTKEELRLGRNEIYARHGRRFNDAALQQYFDSKSWYHGTIAPEAFDESCLNTWEKRNIRLIRDAEQGPFASMGSYSTYSGKGGAPKAEEHIQYLSQSELDYYSNKYRPYYGLFLSTYDDPLHISWDQVFYDGMDRQIEDFTAVYQEYTAVTGEEPFSDVTAVRRTDVEDVVRTLTGTEYSQAQHPLEEHYWVWLPGLQAYAHDHGDTNRAHIDFTSGEISADTMTLHFMMDVPYQAVFHKKGSDWYIFSCMTE